MKINVFLCLASFLLSLVVLDAPRLYSAQVPVLDKGAKQRPNRVGTTARSDGPQAAGAKKSVSAGRASVMSRLKC